MISDSQVIFEKSVKGRKGVSLPNADVTKVNLSDAISPDLLRDELANLPEVSEPQVIRHYVNLSIKNHHVDRDLYPLGSCTMKYNPKINDVLSALPGFTNIHPNQPAEKVQGALHIMYELGQMLLKITGMSDATLQPSAGSQGEFAGILIMKKFHEKNGEVCPANWRPGDDGMKESHEGVADYLKSHYYLPHVFQNRCRDPK